MKALLIILLSLPMFCNAQDKDIALITDFKQGLVPPLDAEFGKCLKDKKLGNCVAVAVIKAALATFPDVASIFRTMEYNETKQEYYIVFKDGISIVLSKQEIDTAGTFSKIQSTSSKYYDSAIRLYAAMCKRIELNKNLYPNAKCIHNFKNAVEYLNSGFSAKNGYTLLGLNYEPIPFSQLNKTKGVVIWCSAHAAYASQGIQDDMGEAKKLKVKTKWLFVFNSKKVKMRNTVRYSKVKGAYTLY